MASFLSRAESDGSANGSLPLKLGIYWNDGVVAPQPPIARGLRTVVKAVQAAGHKAGTTILKQAISGLNETLCLHLNIRSWNEILHLKQLPSASMYSHLLQILFHLSCMIAY